MKKLGVVLLVLLQCSVYAGEGTLSVGMQYGLMLEKVSTGATTNSMTLHSYGGNLRATNFSENSNMGIFVNDSFLFPQGGKINGTNFTLENVDFAFLLGMTLGPVYRKSLDQTKTAYIGIGPSFQQFTLIDEQSGSSMNILFGIGSDFGCTFALSETNFIHLGMQIDYSFAIYSLVNNRSGVWHDEDYSNVTVRPYIGIGMVVKKRDHMPMKNATILNRFR
ncbi:MAG: hypothetical protein EOM68_22270 [Spirochaetia bacterium]|nr:hypothetical protein [Spirochaetia bacterium]